jgi:hypothetical protein
MPLMPGPQIGRGVVGVLSAIRFEPVPGKFQIAGETFPCARPRTAVLKVVVISEVFDGRVKTAVRSSILQLQRPDRTESTH